MYERLNTCTGDVYMHYLMYCTVLYYVLQVLQHELRSVREACMKLESGYEPGITFVVVQKRHHTRLFCSDPRDMVSTLKALDLVR